MLTIIVAFVAGGLLVWALMNVRVARITAEREIAQARASQLEASREDVKNLFVAEAQRAFRNVSETLVQMNKTQVDGSLETKRAEIDGLLKPLRDMVENYRGELVKSEHARNASYGGLQEQIRSLLTIQESAQREATRLANVLQSPTTRGNWGEITLRRCVELAGMTEYCDFFVQETIEGEERRRLRPDMLIRLPNGRVIAVDSKAPVTMETDEEQRKALLRRHVEALSRKEYQNALDDSLDFVVLFVPGEQFLPHDGELFESAAQKKIFIASPAILIPLLRAVEAGWKAERTEENAKKMHDAGVELFNRFVTAMEKIAAIGRALESTVGKYNEAIRSIDSRLWPKGEEMQRMAGSGKELANLEQIEATPLQSSRLRLTMQSEDEGTVVPIER
ncbi:MAG TPA: DNA recombination protein RmuC [Thermoanaerobaculia bacterium]|nr:DNA recombination protein RmuC [Thermoanaerobaculia bacterium]